MAGGESGRSFEYTPTWVVAVVCFVIVFISVLAERGLHKLGRLFKRKGQDPLLEALQKLKEELMLLGFISLLLTVFQRPISKICMPEHLSNTMLPCKMKETTTKPHQEIFHININRRSLLSEESASKCPKGHIQFLSLEALHQLHIFIFVMAVVYVFFCATTMVLGGIKIRQWSHWEHSIRNEATRHHRRHGYARVQLKEFMERAGNYWRKFAVISWVVAFFKQFYGSVTKSDYTALRSGFIREHCPSNTNYNFHKYMLRTLEKDFKKIIGISWYLWLFVVIFLLLNIAGWHAYFWMSFLPLVLLLIVGAKLEHIISELAKEAAGSRHGDVTVRLSDELFWFHSPNLVLYLIHFILFQNSFEIAFFLWIWTTYGFNSCIMEGLDFIIPRLVMGVIVQVLCSYSTLPLYALVSQMGSKFKQTVFNEFQEELIRGWLKDRNIGSGANMSANRLTIDMANPVCLSHEPVIDRWSRASDIELPPSHHPHIPFS